MRYALLDGVNLMRPCVVKVEVKPITNPDQAKERTRNKEGRVSVRKRKLMRDEITAV